MSNEACRLAIITQFETAMTAYPTSPKPLVQYENRNLVDTSTQTLPFIGIDIVNINGHQLELGSAGISVQYGQIIVTAFCKENTGSRDAGLLLDYFLPYFDKKELGIVRTQSAMYSKAKTVKGWQGYPVTVPFWWTR